MITFRKQENAFLLGVITSLKRRWEAEESFEELKSLVATAGPIKVGESMAELREINPGTFIGKGKAETLKKSIQAAKADVVIFDGELSPSQNQKLEQVWGVRVIDRTGLILDIFALHAKSKEGKLQVELAQCKYLYPRLVGAWSHLSKQRGGGVGLRGPGETQLEVDRRRVRERLNHLNKSLKKVSSSRELHRQKREKVPIPTITMVGYTNAGKSTLFNALTQSRQLAEDKLFATLDPKTKRIKLPSGRVVLVSDTVGFIRNLPHQLVEAFKSTFEEAGESDLLVHVVDGSHSSYTDQIEVVEKVLKELDLNDIPVVTVMNKMDAEGFHFSGNGTRTILTSAIKEQGLENVLHCIEQVLSETLAPMKLFIPHPYGQLLSSLYKHGRVFHSKNKVKGVEVEVALPEKWQRKFEPYSI